MLSTIKTCAAISALFLSTQSFSQTVYGNPASPLPMTLLAVPAEPVAYYTTRARARSLLDLKKAAEAEPLVEQITRDYPRDGDNWLMLGEVKRALNKHLESAVAYERAGERLKWGTGKDPAALAAMGYLRAGNRRVALDLLRHHVSGGGEMDRSWLYNHDDFASLRSDPEFLEISGLPNTAGWSREDGWRKDVDFLREEVKRLNADYRRSPLPSEFERRHKELRGKVAQLSDEEIFVGMNRMLAVLNQGHTSVHAPKESRIPVKGLPFQMYLFPEGIFIIDAVGQHKDLIGSRVIAIEDVPAEEALRRVNETQSIDGYNQYLFQGVNLLHSISYLKGLGIAKTSEAVRVTLQQAGQVPRTILVQTSSFRETAKLMPLEGVETPLFLQEAKEMHWGKELPDHEAYYVHLNAVANEPEESLAQFSLRLRGRLSDGAPKNLILDMRNNPGGSTNNAGYAEFLRTMIGFSLLPDRQLYVLIGRRTYSAAGNLITELEQLANAVFVGEASSECCTFYGSPSGFILPFSKLRGTISTKRWSLSRKGNDFRREMNPHAPVITTAREYFAGRDAVMDTALRIIMQRRADPSGTRQTSANTSH